MATISTIGGCGYQSDSPVNGIFKGLASGANISFDVIWTPPTFIDPRPDFTLIPDADAVFQVPDLPEPAAITGTVLPQSSLVYAVPQAGAPATSSAVSTILPEVSSATSTSSYVVPLISADTNIAGNLANLPAVSGNKFQFGLTTVIDGATETSGFTVPTITAATSDAADFPTTTDFFSSGIPSTDADSSGVNNVPNLGDGNSEGATDMNITASDIAGEGIKGIAYDSTDGTFWIVTSGTASN
jgi:hypothetical protein